MVKTLKTYLRTCEVCEGFAKLSSSDQKLRSTGSGNANLGGVVYGVVENIGKGKEIAQKDF